MRDLPSGTVTFLFTDIEGSTRLLKQLGDRYGELLTEHQRILRECFEAYGGREVDTQGDSFFVAFARAGDAVASAIDAQHALQRQAWPDGVQVRVRMGLHSGEPRAAGERYVGLGVHKAARVGAVGHGDQILISNATRELVEDALPVETRLRDLGAYELKDVDRPERLYQVESDGLRGDFPPLRARRVGGPRRARPLLVVGAVLVIAAVAAAVAWTSFANEAGAAVGSAENPIRIVTPWIAEDPEHKALEELLTTFEESTGFEADARPLDPNATTDLFAVMEKLLRSRVAGDDPPTLAIVPSTGIVSSLARDGIAKPLSALDISDAHVRQSYGDAWTDLATFREEVYGFPVKATSKSLLWYRPVDLARVGVTVPKTWAELVSATSEIERAGETPWSLAADDSDSWTLTDWFENLYIRTSGPWKYDALFAGTLPFDDPSVSAALRRMTTLLDDESVAGGIAGAMVTGFAESMEAMFGPEPSAHLYLEGGFVGPLALQYIEPTPKPGRTIAAAPLPRIEPSVGSPVVVGADFVVPFEDDDAVRALLLYLSSTGAGRIWASTGAIVSPHRRVPLSAYPNVLVRTEARQLIEAKVVRLDGSDLLPGTLASELGSTLQQVLQRPDDASELMREFQSKAARVFRQ
jgi:alpha-glucoside transport system substrate-binding protein